MRKEMRNFQKFPWEGDGFLRLKVPYERGILIIWIVESNKGRKGIWNLFEENESNKWKLLN